MKRIAVRSSEIAILGYDEKKKILEVAFKTGNVYTYEAVPQEVFEAFLKADSYGQYFEQYIRDHYACRKTTDQKRI
ncbi:MAG: KTSC domain-containing protein [Candidatus Omnitrophota bacterium]